MAGTVSSRRGAAVGDGLGCSEAGPGRALRLWYLTREASLLPPALGRGEADGSEPCSAPSRIKGRVNSWGGSAAGPPTARARGGEGRRRALLSHGG